MNLRSFPTLILLVALAVGVSACGRKGALDTPSQAAYERDREAAKKAGQPAPPAPSREKPDRRFILDGLID